jgi:hypothetical protein
MTTRKIKAVAKPPALTEARPPAIMTAKENAAWVALQPSANAAAVVEAYGTSYGEQDINALIVDLRVKFDQVSKGDLRHCEAMLVGQANALQAIFVNLARRAVSQEYLNQYATHLSLALKAQNQCRATLETLAAIKNPPVVFAKQANINQGNGNQQVNNGTPAPATHAGKNINQQNELLEVQHGSETVVTQTTGKAIGKDKAMAPVETVHRGTHP